MIRPRVLFVDDEPAILNGLRDLLRKDRDRWDIGFAVGGEQALLEMKRAPAQVVVCDMRMPGMDGAELLARVKQEYPSTARLVLSGHAQRDASVRAMSVAHQFLSKPCEVSVLRSAIERTIGLIQLLDNSELRAVATGLERLPSVPRAYLDISEIASDSSKGVSDLTMVVERDPAMSVKILQLVNSSYFGAARRVSSISQAVSLLGAELLKGLALTANVFVAMEAASIPGFSIEKLQRSSVMTAQLARRFLNGSRLADEAFTAGLIHDVGQIVIALSRTTEYAAIAERARSSGQPLHVAEKELLGVTHADVGAYLLGVWGLPFSIVECVAFHHQPDAIGQGPCPLLAAVYAADALLDEGDSIAGEQGGDLDLAFLERAGVTAELPRWREQARESRREAGMSP